MKIFRVPSAVCELLEPMQPVMPSEGSIQRYAQSYYVRAENADEAVLSVRAYVWARLANVVDIEAPEECSLSDIPGGLLSRPELKKAQGVLWSSGRTFFSDESPS